MHSRRLKLSLPLWYPLTFFLSFSLIKQIIILPNQLLIFEIISYKFRGKNTPGNDILQRSYCAPKSVPARAGHPDQQNSQLQHKEPLQTGVSRTHTNKQWVNPKGIILSSHFKDSLGDGLFPIESNKILSLRIRRSSKVKLTRTVSVSPCCSSSCHPAKCWTGADLRKKAETDRKKRRGTGQPTQVLFCVSISKFWTKFVFWFIRFQKSSEVIYLSRFCLKISKQLKALCVQ